VSNIAVESSSVGSDQDLPITIAAKPISTRDRNIALATIVVLAILDAIVIPFASVHLHRVDPFIPVLQTVMCAVDLLTAALLFAQYSIQPLRAIIPVASGYVFSGLFAFIQTLAFPGAYSPTGVIGDGLNSAAWFFVLWHTTFPLALIVYVFTKDSGARLSKGSTRLAITSTLACALAAVAGLTWLATHATQYLPDLYLNAIEQTPFGANINLFLWAMNFAAFILLFVRRRTILDLWLTVVLFAWWPNFLVAVAHSVVRFSAGWYTARLVSLVASSMLLIVLLAESTALYARLASAVVRLRREQETKITSAQAIVAAIAHEIRQPLTRITAGGGAAQRFLKMVPPELDKAQAALDGVVNAGHRTSGVIDGFRSLFGKAGEEQQLVDMNELIPEVLETLNSELKDHRVSIRVDLTPKLPLVSGNKSQLQEVVSNLIINSIEAMETKSLEGRLLLIHTEIQGDNIAVAVEDSGPGIDKDQLGDIFTPFATTKPHGMGLGLAISRMIIDYHGGKLIAASDSKYGGASFHFVLPTADRR
jgi:signal transduction histidine kinase